MIRLHQLDHSHEFPAIHHALEEPNGLLAFGGDLSVERLIAAYSRGIFPWFGEDEPILWWSPDPRGILPLDEFHCARSLHKLIRQQRYRVTLNHAFDAVIDQCAGIPRQDNGTWITDEMIQAYRKLHRAGYAHSVEVWQQDALVGGLYGVAIGSVFCGESMFSVVSNGSKIAFYHLVTWLKDAGGDFIDCQMQTEHLRSLGCKEVSRRGFLDQLRGSRDKALAPDTWAPRVLSP